MDVRSHISESTWKIDAVAPAFPPEIAFLADCCNIFWADGSSFADADAAAIVSAFAGALDRTIEEAAIAAVETNTLRDEIRPDSIGINSGTSSLSKFPFFSSMMLVVAASVWRIDSCKEEYRYVLHACDGRTNASEIVSRVANATTRMIKLFAVIFIPISFLYLN